MSWVGQGEGRGKEGQKAPQAVVMAATLLNYKPEGGGAESGGMAEQKSGGKGRGRRRSEKVDG